MAAAMAPGSGNELKIHREGLTVVVNPPAAQIESEPLLVIIHGLKGTPHGTFRCADSGFYWPVHIQEHLPSARVMVFGYLADVVDGSNNSLGVYQHAENLLVHLKNLRVGNQATRPLVFVGHSLGGLVIKQTLVISSHRPMDLDLLSSTKAVFFLGTPHRGSHVLDKMVPQVGLKLGKMINCQIPSEVHSMLQPRTNESFVANSDFMKIKGTISIVNFYEQAKTPGLGSLVVDKDSAVFDSEFAENIPVARNHHQLVRYENSEDATYRTLYQTLQRTIAKILSDVYDSEHESTVTKLSQECINSLAASQTWRRQDLLDGPHRSSLGWLWEEKSEFTRWLANGSGFFHITGKPGSGKSILMGSVVARARRYCRTDIVVHHFFNNRGQALDYSLAGFLRSSLEQILRREPSLFQYMIEEWRMAQDYTPGSYQWSLPLLKEALIKVLSQGSQSFRILLILDALDECEGVNAETDVLSFLKIAATSSKTNNLRAVFSCRYLPDTTIPNLAGGFRMEQRNEADIINLVNDEWSSVISAESMNDDLRALKKTIVQKADGIFLWVRLALQRVFTAVREGDTVAEIRETIDDIPSELADMFEMLLAQVDQKHRSETYLMLSIVLTSKRPLTLTEFRVAVGLCRGKFDSIADMDKSKSIITENQAMLKRIRSRCGGLLEVKAVGETWQRGSKDPQSLDGGIVQFVHQSVKEFLLVQSKKETSGVPDRDRLVADGHAKLADGCLQYLKMQEITTLQPQLVRTASETSLSSDLPLLQYAVGNWEWHCEHAERLGIPQADLIQQSFGPETTAFSHWLQLYNAMHPVDKKIPEDYSLCELAVQNNLASLVAQLCQSGELDVDGLIGEMGTYLCLAVFKGCKETVKVLLDRGANPETRGFEAGRPVLIACRMGHLEILQMLLDVGADFHGGLDMYNVHPSIPEVGMFLRPIVMAAYSGNADVVRLVLEYDPEAVVNPWHRQYAILCLVIGARQAVKSLTQGEQEPEFLSRVSKLLPLLSGGADYDTGIFSMHLMPDICAAWGYSEKAMQMLLDTEYASSPRIFSLILAIVCKYGPLRSVQFLVERCNIDMVIHMTTHNQGNLLHRAVTNPNTSVTAYLLDLGLDINAQNRTGLTPLHNAAVEDSDAQIELLLARGADGSLKDILGYTPFHKALTCVAMWRPQKILAQLLSSSKGSTNSPIRDGLKPIHLAAAVGWLPTVEWLIQNGADLQGRDEFSRTALHAAAASRGLDSINVLKFLVNHGLSVADRDDAGMTPLHHVFYSYDNLHAGTYDPDVSTANAKYLLQQGANPAVQDEEGNTFLHLAAWRGHVGIVKILLRDGVDASITNRGDQKPLDIARDEEVRKLLEQNMVECQSKR